uniref:Protein FAR1-RELATED SEQUENCE n=1 Tax=Davidia involucrata TaxID=16924 RepID=A0A5B7A3Y2_DAVIN
MEEHASSSLSNMEIVEGEIGNELELVNLEDKVEEPDVGKIFNSYDEVYDYYIRYAKKMGFAVSKRTSSRGRDGELKYITFTCSRAGKSRGKPKNRFRPHPITKTECPARIRAILIDDGTWQVNSLEKEHNHELSPGKTQFFRCNRLMKPYVRRKLEMNDRVDIRIDKSYNACVVEAGVCENMTFLKKDCRNFVDKARRLCLREGDAIAIQNYFLNMQANNSNFFYMMDLDEEGRLRNVFWADARSRAAYKEFGDVITFDTTYLTNKYDMPFVPFVGVNHHGQSILLGCGLISNEDIPTFTWLFESWLACMSGHAPSAIITDQDKVMKKAIENVFPNTRHRWCLWHIMKKLPEKLGGYKEYESIKFLLQKAVYDSLSPNEFEENWNMMIEKYKIHDNVWLLGMYKERRRWVPTFVKDSFWAGMFSTQRSESMHAFFDGYVNSKTSLKQFVEQYENVLRNKVEKENLQDFSSFNSLIPCITHYDMEKQFQGVYTMAKFKEFQLELTGKLYCDLEKMMEDGSISEFKVFEDVKVGESQRRVDFKVCFNEENNEVKCNCRLFEFQGILCRHAIAVLLKKKIYLIPERYILRRWRKDVKRCYTRIKISYNDLCAKLEAERFDKMCDVFCEVADMATDSEDKYNMVMTWIHDMKNGLKDNEGVCGSNEPTPKLSVEKNSVGEGQGHVISRESKNVLTPVPTRSKGHPPDKRKQSKLEQIDRKRKTKREKKEFEGNNTTFEGELKDFQMIENEDIGHIECPTTSNVADIIRTQDSIVVSNIGQVNQSDGGTYTPATQIHGMRPYLMKNTISPNFHESHIQGQYLNWKGQYGMVEMPTYHPRVIVGVNATPTMNHLQGNPDPEGHGSYGQRK